MILRVYLTGINWTINNNNKRLGLHVLVRAISTVYISYSNIDCKQ